MYWAPSHLIQIYAAEFETTKVKTITSAPWFVHNNNSDGKGCSHCECKENFGDVVICDEKLQKSYLQLSYCMSYNSSSSEEQESDAVSFCHCPYIYYSNIVNNRYIDLPQNTSDLNDVFNSVPHWIEVDGCARIALMALALQLLALATLVQTAQRTTMGGCCISYQNFFLQRSFTL